MASSAVGLDRFPRGLLVGKSERGYLRSLTMTGRDAVIREDRNAESEAAPPNWLYESRQRLLEFVHLPLGWDLEGGEPLNPSAANAAFHLLLRFGPMFDSAPDLVPVGDGGVMVEWHTANVDLEIEIEANLNGSVFFRDKVNNSQSHFEPSFGFLRPRSSKASD